jgi:excisionase family DNA binding protein
MVRHDNKTLNMKTKTDKSITQTATGGNGTPQATATGSAADICPPTRAAGIEPGVELYIKKGEVARRLQKTVRTVENLMRRGILPFYKIGRSVVFKWSDIESHLAQTCRVWRK